MAGLVEGSRNPADNFNMANHMAAGFNIAGHNMVVPNMPGQASGIVAEQAASSRPQMLRVIGRREQRENSDICGEYSLVGTHDGRAVYRMASTGTAIRYYSPMGRWVIDRRGIHDSDVGVAYADESLCNDHPACGQELIWHVWESGQGQHVADMEVMVLDAPRTLALVGRPGSDCVEFEVAGVQHGRPIYKNGQYLIRYDGQEGRWFICQAISGNLCMAYADGAKAQHPGKLGLLWNFWDDRQSAHIPDPNAKLMDVPLLLHLFGRRSGSDNTGISGTYWLEGVSDARPIYAQRGTNYLIRYCAEADRWLLHRSEQATRGLMNRITSWIFQSDSAQNCDAFADAKGTSHPGHAELEWLVFETRAGRHVMDPEVRSTTAPLALTIAGRDPARDAASVINGEYLLACAHLGFPAYQKNGSDVCISYWPPRSRWTITHGLCNSESCIAYVEKAPNKDHPSDLMLWHVFEGFRGAFISDPNISVIIPVGGPKAIPGSVGSQIAHLGGA